MPKEIISLPSLEVQAGSRPDSQGNKKKQSSMDLAQCEREVMYGDIDLKSPNHEKCKKHEDPVQNGDIDLFQVQQSSKIVTKDRTKACVGKESSEDKGESSVAESSCIDLKNKKHQKQKEPPGSLHLGKVQEGSQKADEEKESPEHKKVRSVVQNKSIDGQQNAEIVTGDGLKACAGKESSEKKEESSVAKSSYIDLKNKKQQQKQKVSSGSLQIGKVQELFKHDVSQKAFKEKESPEQKNESSVVGNKSMAGQKSSEIVIEDGPKACAGRERPENMGKCIDLKNEKQQEQREPPGSLQMGEVKKVLNHNGSQKACEDLGSSQVYGNVEMVKSVKDIRKPGTVLQFERIIRFYNLEILTYYHYIIIKDAKHIVDEKEITVVSFPGSVRQLS